MSRKERFTFGNIDYIAGQLADIYGDKFLWGTDMGKEETKEEIVEIINSLMETVRKRGWARGVRTGGITLQVWPVQNEIEVAHSGYRYTITEDEDGREIAEASELLGVSRKELLEQMKEQAEETVQKCEEELEEIGEESTDG